MILLVTCPNPVHRPSHPGQTSSSPPSPTEPPTTCTQRNIHFLFHLSQPQALWSLGKGDAAHVVSEPAYLGLKKKTKQGNKKQTEPIVLVPFVLWVSASGPTPGGIVSLEGSPSPEPAGPQRNWDGKWCQELALLFFQGTKPQREPLDVGIFHQNRGSTALHFCVLSPLIPSPDTCSLKGSPQQAQRAVRQLVVMKSTSPWPLLPLVMQPGIAIPACPQQSVTCPKRVLVLSCALGADTSDSS